MTIFVFLGPTLPVDDAKEILDAVYLPPAKTGDVYRVAQQNPQAIVIIDGYFDSVPTIWHKEILWAMKQGIHVFGSSSMGALRATELHAFGMEGVGQIFNDFHQNILEDDDEVTVAHTNEEDGFRNLSVAMVDIRATLKLALSKSVIDEEIHNLLVSSAKQVFYPERNYESLFEIAQERTVLDLMTIKTWLMNHHVPQKQLDAIELLETVRERFMMPQAQKQVDYAFQNTVMWIGLTRQAGRLDVQSKSYEHLSNDHLIDELRLNPEAYYRMMRLTLLQLCAGYIAQGENWSEDGLKSEENMTDFMKKRQLNSDNFEAWLQQNSMTLIQFEAYLANYLRINQLELNWYDDIINTMPEILKLSGHYATLAKRANRKQKMLSDNYLDVPDMADTGLTKQALYRWYFVERLNMPTIPDNISAHIQVAGFASIMTFERALVREYLYHQLRDAD